MKALIIVMFLAAMLAGSAGARAADLSVQIGGNARPDYDDYYQGRRGRWDNSWHYDTDDGRQYHQDGNRWTWYERKETRRDRRGDRGARR